MMKEFDPTKVVDQFSNMLKTYNMPGVDMESIVTSQKKNLEALTSANRVVIEGIQSVAKRQAEILQETMNEATKALDTLTKASSPQDIAAQQADLAKNAFERALGNMRELADMVTKANQQAADTINSRISATLGEIKELAVKAKQS
ncbi:phasin family protein [Defluviicoccus vanus]|uniref:Phasin family protein n=2 Tax=Defluviicoccus vanus TaxID=111831 RepID=A0A7H1N6J4_9PROT|nr:phasin family protein [Defluviicoccus vanus]